MIVVIDSGVWISAMAFGGTPDLAIQQAIGIDRVAACDEIKDEITKTLSRKIGWDELRLAEAFAIYFQDVIWVPIHGNIRGVCRDSKDDVIIECAVNSNAELIISGDKDLLVLKQYNQIRIITPREYVAPPANGKRL